MGIKGSLYIKVKKASNGGKLLYLEGRYSMRGVQKAVSLGRVEGEPPTNNDLNQRGDTIFEKFRKQAEFDLQKFLNDLEGEKSEADREKHQGKMAKSILKEKYGESSDKIRLDELWEKFVEKKKRKGKWEQTKKTKDETEKRLFRFIKFLNDNHPKVSTLDEVTEGMIVEFKNSLKESKLVGRTINGYLNTLHFIFENFCNWNKDCLDILSVKEKTLYESHDIFSEEEINLMIKKAEKVDPEIKSLILIGYNTGLRLKDMVLLKWESINFDKKILTLRTYKTNAQAELSMGEPLIAELKKLKPEDCHDEYVLPGLAEVYNESSVETKSGKIHKRFVNIMRLAGIGITNEDISPYPAYDKKETIRIVSAAIKDANWSEDKQEKGMNLLELYLQEKSYSQISEETGVAKGTICLYLSEMEKLSQCEIIIREGKLPFGTKNLNRSRLSGSDDRFKRAAKLTIHSLRGTFVSRAAALGYTMEQIQRFLGAHSDKILMKHYYHNQEHTNSAHYKNTMALNYLKTLKRSKWVEHAIELLER